MVHPHRVPASKLMGVPSATPVLDRPRPGAGAWSTPLIILAAATVLAIATIGVPSLRVLSLAPRAQIAVEASTSASFLFGALVLVLVAQDPERQNLRWVAAGLALLAAGNLVFGMFWPMLLAGWPDPNAAVGASLLVAATASILIAVGLAEPGSIPSSRSMAILGSISIIWSLAAFVAVTASWPRLVNVANLEAAARTMRVPMNGLTVTYTLLSAAVVAIIGAAVVGATRRIGADHWGGWLPAAVALLGGAAIHNSLWPTVYSGVLTWGSFFRLGAAVTIGFGGAFELHRMATERKQLLEAEQRHAGELAELHRLKQSVSRTVAHDLISPITVIRLQLLMLQAYPDSADERAEAIRAIGAEADRLGSLVHDVRAIGALDLGDVTADLRPVDADDLLRGVALQYGHLLTAGVLVPAQATGTTILADPERIRELLRHLIGNAARYASQSTTIVLRATGAGSRLIIEVVDHGPGVPPAEAERVFERFFRGERDRQHVPGLGLGLSRARAIARAHGGDLVFKPTPGGGATFALDLQIDASVAAAPCTSRVERRVAA